MLDTTQTPSNTINTDTNIHAKTDLYPEQQHFREKPFCLGDEKLHPPADPVDASSSETSYFGFSIPEAAINAEIYHWFHPTSRLCSGGMWIWQGVKPLMLQADYFNYQLFSRLPKLDLDDWQSPIGVQQKVVHAGQQIHVEFWDKQQNTGFSIEQFAIMPPAVRAEFAYCVRGITT